MVDSRLIPRGEGGLRGRESAQESRCGSSMNILPTKLFDRQSKQDVSATIRFDLTADEVLGIEAMWRPWRQAAIARLGAAGLPEEEMPQHWHWDWAQKVPKFGL